MGKVYYMDDYRKKKEEPMNFNSVLYDHYKNKNNILLEKFIQQNLFPKEK